MANTWTKISKSKYLAALLLVILSVGVFYIFYDAYLKPSPKQSAPVSNLSSGTEPVQSEDVSTQTDTKTITQDANLKFNVYKDSESEILYKLNVEEVFVNLNEEEKELPNNSILKVLSGQGYVLLPNNSMMTLEAGTEAQIALTENDTNIIQSSGNTWHRIQKLTDSKAYNVETSNTLATVRGTIFGVKSESESETGVYVLESQVEVSSNSSKQGSQKIKPKMIQSGQHALIKDTATESEVTSISDLKKKTYWFRLNRLIDNEFEKGVKPIDILRKLKQDPTILDQIQKLKQEFQVTPVVNKVTTTNQTTTIPKALDLQKILGLQNLNCDDFDATSAELSFKQAVDSKQLTSLKDIEQVQAFLDKVKQECGTDTGGGVIVVPKVSAYSSQITSNTSTATPIPTTTSTATNTVNNTTITPPVIDPNFTAAIRDLKAKYLYYSLTNTRTYCSMYNQTSITNILAEFTAVEKKYNQPQVLAIQLKPAISAIFTACKDGFIDANENQTIQPLIV